MKMIATRKDPSTILRLPGNMRDRLSDIARGNGRSRNSEIVIRLQRSLDSDVDTNKNAPAAVNG